VLSDKAKKFAIAQKLVEMDSIGNWIFYTFVPLAGAWILNMVSSHTNDIFKMLERPWFARYGLYSVHSGFTLFILMYLYTTYQNELDKTADEKLVLMGRDYLEGGEEFYTKETRRGLLLRKGLSARGEQFYDKNGELERLWYEPQLAGTPGSIPTSRITTYVELLA